MKKYELLGASVVTEKGGKIPVTELLSLLGGPEYKVYRYPLIGHVVIRDGQRVEIENEPEQDDFLQIAYEWHVDGDQAGELCRIYVGSRYTRGIYLQYTHHNGCDGTPKWYAAYANGNCGKNYAAGGTWSRDRRVYDTLADALDARFCESMPHVGPVPIRDAYYMESRALGREIKKRLAKYC